MRILIADDNEIALLVLRNTLEQAGYEVESASDGRSALEIIRRGACRLVVSDWEMPELTGIQLCQAIRTEEMPGYIYVILLTARDSTDEKIAGLSAGADDFIAKPFNPAELLARVHIGERVLP